MNRLIMAQRENPPLPPGPVGPTAMSPIVARVTVPDR